MLIASKVRAVKLRFTNVKIIILELVIVLATELNAIKVRLIIVKIIIRRIIAKLLAWVEKVRIIIK